VRSFLPFVCLFLCCSLLEGQSLVELAKKEKDRRKANADAGRKASVDAEGGGTRPGSEEELNSRRPLTREETIALLVKEEERLRDERDRMFGECSREMDERGYEKISNNLPACAEFRALEKERNSVAQKLNDLHYVKKVR
jgi:hypothetical protein